MASIEQTRGASQAPVAPAVIEFAGFRFDPVNRFLYRGADEVPLPPKAVDLLEFFLAHPGEVLSKEALFESVWDDSVVTDASLFQAVSQLRQALGDDPRHPAILETVHKRGYRLLAQVGHVAREQAPSAADIRRGSGRRAAVALALATTVAVAVVMLRPSGGVRGEAPEVDRRLDLPIALSTEIWSGHHSSVALSPDGRWLTYTGEHGGQLAGAGLWTLSLADGTSQLLVSAAQPLVSTATGVVNPTYSPDGSWVAYTADGKLWKVPAEGGLPQALADVNPVRPGGIAWGVTGHVVFSPGPGAGLQVVDTDGDGAVRELTTPTAPLEYGHVWPSVLPDGDTVLFGVRSVGADMTGRDRIGWVSLATGERGVLEGVRGTAPRFVAPGTLVYAQGNTLLTATLDTETLAASDTTLLAEGVRHVDAGGPNFAVAHDGTVVILPAPADGSGYALAWLDESGRPDLLPTPRGWITRPVVDPAGRRLAYRLDGDIWLYDTERAATTRLTTNPAHETWPIWDRTGEGIVYSSNAEGPYGLYRRSAVNSQREVPVVRVPGNAFVGDMRAGDDTLLYTQVHPATGYDVWYARDNDPSPLLTSDFNEFAGSFSPDGAYFTYHSDETGSMEAYLQPFPPTGERWQLTGGSGWLSRWSPSGDQVYFQRDGGLWAVDVAIADGTVTVGREQRITPVDTYVASFDVAQESGRIVVLLVRDRGMSTVRLLLNAFPSETVPR